MPAVAGREPKAADSAGAGQAMEAVRHTEALLAALDAEPAPVLRSGGVGVRELRRLAQSAGLDEPLAALLLEVASAAGLVGELEVTVPSIAIGRATVDRQILPTAAVRRLAGRLDRPALDRPGRGVAGDDPPARAGRAARRARPADQRAVAGGGTRPARRPSGGRCSAVLDRPGPGRRAHRRRGPRAAGLAGAPAQPWPGADLPRGARRGGPARRHRAGRRSRVRPAAATPTTRPPPAPAGVRDDPLGQRPGADRSPDAPPAAVAALDALLPAPVDHVLVQADLTVVVPGPPEPALAAELELAAESAGGGQRPPGDPGERPAGPRRRFRRRRPAQAVPPPVADPGAAGADAT